MTREQLDVIRARVDEAANRNWSMEAKVLVDARALLAEVERLRDAHAMAVQVSGELCELCGWAMKFPEEPCRCELLAEVARLTAERDAAFKRGVAAMREAAASHFSVVAPYDYIAPRIRALPDPEDK